MKDNDNPQFIFSSTNTELLIQIANDKLDAVYLAKKELINRGIGKSGKWSGFPEAANQWLTPKKPSIKFTALNVLDAWSEMVSAKNYEEKIDYIKLHNGVMITVTQDKVRVFDADDIEVPNSTVEVFGLIRMQMLEITYENLVQLNLKKSRLENQMARTKFTRTPSDIFPPGVFELEVSYTRRSLTRVKLTSSDETATFARSVVYKAGSIQYCELFYVLMLDRANQVFAYKQISQGGITSTFSDAKLIFQTALLCHAPSIIIMHNHPSGNAKPSSADVKMTKQIVEGGKILEITVLDHLILTAEGHFSFADEGLM